jgi:malate/lactate dehydrogenase
MGVISDGSYDIEKGLVFSYPVQIKNGKISIVQGLKLDDWSREMIEKTHKELVEEKNDALKATSSD